MLFQDHHLCGLHLGASCPLPDLPVAQGMAGQDPEITLLVEALAPILPEATHRAPLFQLRGLEDCLFDLPGLGRALISRGNRVVLDPLVTLPEVLSSFWDVVLPLLSLQRGWVPFRASAVVGPAGAVLIVGHSGSGKSVAAAQLLSGGFSCAGDGVVPVDLSGSVPMLRPTSGTLRLWPAMADLFTGQAETHSDHSGRVCMPTALPQTAPIPVRGIVRLRVRAGGIEMGSQDETGVDALALVQEAVAAQAVARLTGQLSKIFAANATMVQTVPCVTLVRDTVIGSLPAWQALLERSVRHLLGQEGQP